MAKNPVESPPKRCADHLDNPPAPDLPQKKTRTTREKDGAWRWGWIGLPPERRDKIEFGCTFKLLAPTLSGEARSLPYFCASETHDTMGHDHDHHDHAEAEQNEIGGPVVFALLLFAIVITSIYFLS